MEPIYEALPPDVAAEVQQAHGSGLPAASDEGDQGGSDDPRSWTRAML